MSQHPLRIQHVIGSFEVGGAERYALQLAHRQARDGHEVHVVGLAPGPLLEVFDRGAVRLHTELKKSRLDPTLPPRLWSLFARNRIHVVHTHNPPPLMYASIAARCVGAALVHTKHGVNHDLQRRVWMRGFLGKLAHELVAVSEDTAHHAMKRGEVEPHRVRVIRNGIDVDQYRPRPEERKRLRAELGFSDELWVVGTVGRLALEKDHASLIRAMAPLIKNGSARLLLAGEGPERNSLEALSRKLGIDHGVLLLGTRQDAHLLLSAMDTFALSSRTEGLPLALLEAMATELPVVATKVGGIPAVLEGSNAGLLVPPRDPKAFEQALDSLHRDPDAARQMGCRARKLVVDRFALETVVKETEALYTRSLLSAKKSRISRLIRRAITSAV